MRPATVHITKEMAVNKNPMNNNNRGKKNRKEYFRPEAEKSTCCAEIYLSSGVGRIGEKSAKVVTKRANRETQREREEDGVLISIINFAQTALEIINGSALD